MGKIKYLKEINEFIDNNIVFNIRDVEAILISRKANPNYARLLLHNLEKKSEIKRIIKGFYTKYDDPTLITFCIKPSYIGLEAALSFHGIWEQETNVVLLTPRRVRTGIRSIFNTNIVIHSINKKHFFGFNYVDYYDFKIPISDIEKTFIDWMYYNKPLTKDILNNFKKKIKKKKLISYLKNYDKKFANKVLSTLNSLCN